MNKQLTAIFAELFSPGSSGSPAAIFDAAELFDAEKSDPAGIPACLNAAFLIMLSGQSHPLYLEAGEYIARIKESAGWSDVAVFYAQAVGLIHQEIDDLSEKDNTFALDLLRKAQNIMNGCFLDF